MNLISDYQVGDVVGALVREKFQKRLDKALAALTEYLYTFAANQDKKLMRDMPERIRDYLKCSDEIKINYGYMPQLAGALTLSDGVQLTNYTLTCSLSKMYVGESIVIEDGDEKKSEALVKDLRAVLVECADFQKSATNSINKFGTIDTLLYFYPLMGKYFSGYSITSKTDTDLTLSEDIVELLKEEG